MKWNFASTANSAVSVETSSNLSNWTPLASLQYLGGTLRFTDSSNSSQRFYRVILEF